MRIRFLDCDLNLLGTRESADGASARAASFARQS